MGAPGGARRDAVSLLGVPRSGLGESFDHGPLTAVPADGAHSGVMLCVPPVR